MIKNLRVLGFVALLMLIFSGTAAAYEANYKDVWVMDNGRTEKYRTSLTTVEELFTKEAIKLEDTDLMNVGITDNLKQGMKIEIQRGFGITLKKGKRTVTESVSPGIWIGKVIYQHAQEDGVEYVYAGEWNQPVYEGMVVNLQEQKTETVIEKEPVPYESAIIETEALPEGERSVAVEGKVGEKEITMAVTYLDGEETKRKVLSEAVITEPVQEVIHLGTGRMLGALTEIEKLSYVQEYLMEATAYTAGPESTGKSPGHPAYGITFTGRQVEHGIVSVDPDVIPLGTELYVEGYGYGLAADTGSAIKGHKIDLFYESYDAAMQFGRRKLKVYVLSPVS